MTSSLRWSLAGRFAATMAAGLTAACAALFYFRTSLLETPPHDVILALVAVVLVGSAAALVGAWWLAQSAVGPVAEITAQATEIELGTLNRRINAHADTQEYQGLVAVLNGMLERLDGAFQGQRRLTADVSHELRSPLTALRGEIEVALRAERSPREYQLVLRSALEEIERLTTMSEDLLLITRAESNVWPLNRAPIELNTVVRDVLERVRRLIEEKGLVVSHVARPGGGVGAARFRPRDTARGASHR